MDGFKNSTKTQYSSGGSCYAKGGSVKGAAKISKVMGEFKSGKLHSGSKSGPEVTSKKQATAIALSEARKAGAKIPVKRGNGGSVEEGDVLISRMNKEELKQGPRGIKHAQERVSREEAKPVRRGVPVAPKAPLIVRRGPEAGDAAAARMAPRVAPDNIRARQARAAALGLKEGGEVKPVKKGLGGILRAAGKVGLGGAAGLVANKGEFPAIGGIGMLQQILKKKQSGQPLTAAEQQQVSQAAPQQAYKKGGAVRKGVPVASKGPLVGLSAMPKGCK